MTRTSTGRFAALFFPLSCCLLIAACGSVRLQTPQQAADNIAKGAQGEARQACQQHRDSRDYFDCVKRANQTYDAWRAERAAQAGKGS